MNKWIWLFCGVAFGAAAQPASETFFSTRIINGHTNEMLAPRLFQYRIEHRFGDAFGPAGGVTAAFGFDNAADIRFALEHGLTKNIMIGVARNKGIGGIYPTALLEGLLKVRLLQQDNSKNVPVSITVTQENFLTYMRNNPDTTALTHFAEFAHRLSYATQMTIARKLNDRGSIAVLPTYVHRNYVAFNEQNAFFALGVGLNLKLTKHFGLMAEYFYNFQDEQFKDPATNAAGIGLEFNTNGHNFRFNLTNARGFGAVQYLAQNNALISEGEWRMGFSITRDFKIRRRK